MGYCIMGTKRGFGKYVVRTFNVSAWIGLDSLRLSARNIKRMSKQLLTHTPSEHKETYQQAIERLKLNAENQKTRKASFLRMSIIYTSMAGTMLGYALFLTMSHHLLAAIMSYVLTFLLLSFAFREHFWYTQMRERRLGMTLRDWAKAVFKYCSRKKST